MEEHGVVVQIKNNIAIIKSERSSACESCASKKTCASGGAPNEMFIEAENTIGAKAGDRIVFSIGASSVIKAGLIIYLVPILSFIFGVVLGQSAGTRFLPEVNPDLISGVVGAAFLIIAFFGLKAYNAFMEKTKSFKPQILRKE